MPALEERNIITRNSTPYLTARSAWRAGVTGWMKSTPKRARANTWSPGLMVPQAYISRNEAAAACRASNKRLCTEREWVQACKGTGHGPFPYGPARKAMAGRAACSSMS